MGNRLLILVEVAVAAAVAHAQTAAQVVHAAKGRGLLFRVLTAKVSGHYCRQLSISHHGLLGRGTGAAGQLLIQTAVGAGEAGARLVHAKK